MKIGKTMTKSKEKEIIDIDNSFVLKELEKMVEMIKSGSTHAYKVEYSRLDKEARFEIQMSIVK